MHQRDNLLRARKYYFADNLLPGRARGKGSFPPNLLRRMNTMDEDEFDAEVGDYDRESRVELNDGYMDPDDWWGQPPQ
jgi:hypothetical protein